MVFSDFIQNCLSIDIINNDIYKVRRGDLSLLHADDFENIAFYGKELNIKFQIDGDNYSEKFYFSNEVGYFIVNDIVNFVLDFYNKYFTENPSHKKTMKNLYFEGFLHKDGTYYIYLFKKIERSAEFNENILKILKDCVGQIEGDVINEVQEYVDIATKLEDLTNKKKNNTNLNYEDSNVLDDFINSNEDSSEIKII